MLRIGLALGLMLVASAASAADRSSYGDRARMPATRIATVALTRTSAVRPPAWTNSLPALDNASHRVIARALRSGDDRPIGAAARIVSARGALAGARDKYGRILHQKTVDGRTPDVAIIGPGEPAQRFTWSYENKVDWWVARDQHNGLSFGQKEASLQSVEPVVERRNGLQVKRFKLTFEHRGETFSRMYDHVILSAAP